MDNSQNNRNSLVEIGEWLKGRLSIRNKHGIEEGDESMASTSTMSKKKKKSSIVSESRLPESIENGFFEHSLTVEQLADLYPLSRINIEKPQKSLGLNQDESLSRLSSDGRNTVCPKAHRSNISLFLRQFLHTFRFLLLLTAILCLIIYGLDPERISQLYLSVIIFAVLFAMSLLGYWQEKNVEKQVRGFQSMIAPSCFVIRQSKESQIDSEALVVGDIVWIRPGSRIAADIRLLWTNGLRLETSWISGEEAPLQFFEEHSDKETTALQAQNIAFKGCQCISGEGIGVVIRTGNNTVIGQLVELSSREQPINSRLTQDHNRFVKFISIISVLMSTATFLIGIAISHLTKVLYVFINGFLIVIVANVPQGLPVTLTAQLVIVARRLSKSNIFLKRLDVSETLGTTSVLMCDKTGVLTENMVTVTDLWFDNTTASVESLIHHTKSTKENERFGMSLERILQTMTLCNRAQMEQPSSGKWRRRSTNQSIWNTNEEKGSFSNGFSVHHATANGIEMEKMKKKTFTGGPTEKALLKFVEQMCSTSAIRSQWEIIFEVPFNKSRRSHLVIAVHNDDKFCEDDEEIRFHIFLKGAPEELFEQCSFYLSSSGERQIDEITTEDFQDSYSTFTRNGCSCIAFAYGSFEAPANTEFSVNLGNFPHSGLSFLGIAALFDPPRENVNVYVEKARQAKIKMHMVTGDHPNTASAIASTIGMTKGDNSMIITGTLLDTLTPQEWDTLLSMENVVFARTNPEQKLKIVEECIRRGEVVCVTGDGVMDAPVLKKAHLGIAIDAVGSIFAKEASDIVLADGHIKYIIDGIEHGRLLFDNLKKTIAYTLAHLTPELSPVLLTFICGWPLALSTMQVLTIDLITELPPSISLIYEGPERDLMKKEPRKASSHLVSKALLAYSYIFSGIIITIGCLCAYLSVFWYYGIQPNELFFTVHKHWHVGAEKLFTQGGLLYDGNNQVKIQMQASAAWQITLVGTQIIHLFSCRTRRVSIFRHLQFNIHSILSVLLSMFLLNVFVYIPGINTIVGAAPPPSFVWLFPLVTGIVLTVFNEIRKWLIRRSPSHPIVRMFKW